MSSISTVNTYSETHLFGLNYFRSDFQNSLNVLLLILINIAAVSPLFEWCPSNFSRLICASQSKAIWKNCCCFNPLIMDWWVVVSGWCLEYSLLLSICLKNQLIFFDKLHCVTSCFFWNTQIMSMIIFYVFFWLLNVILNVILTSVFLHHV